MDAPFIDAGRPSSCTTLNPQIKLPKVTVLKNSATVW